METQKKKHKVRRHMCFHNVLQLKSLLVLFSFHHNNTEKIAKVFA